MNKYLFLNTLSLFENTQQYNHFYRQNKEVFWLLSQTNPFNLTMKEVYYVINNNITYETFLKLKTCKNCNKLTNKFVKKSRGYTTYCSRLCTITSKDVITKRATTNIIKYGTKNPLSSDICKRKARETSLQKYGVEYPSQSVEFQNRVKETCLKKYNKTSALKSPEIRLKIKQTSRLKYGCDCFLATKEYQETKKKKCHELTGVDYYTQTDVFKEKCKKTLMRKYGVDNPMHVNVFKKKIIQTNLKKYGVCYATSSHVKNAKNLNKRFVTTHFIKDGYFLNEEFMKYFGITHTMIGYYKRLWGIKNNSKINKQKQQNMICDELKLFGYHTISNNRKILNGKEIDIIVADKIAIEYNGLMYHSSGNSNVKKFTRSFNKMYHMEKAINISTHMFHPLFIFEHDYKENKEFFISLIKRITSTKNYLYVVYKQISNTIAESFISKNEPCYNNTRNAAYIGGYIDDRLCIVCEFIEFDHNLTIQNIIFDIDCYDYDIFGLFVFLKDKYQNKSLFWYDDLKYSKHLIIPDRNRVVCGYVAPKCFYFKPHPFVLYYDKPTETDINIRWFHDCGKVILEILL